MSRTILNDMATLRLVAEHHGLSYAESLQQLINYPSMENSNILGNVRVVATLDRISDCNEYCSIVFNLQSIDTSGYDK